jgi:hypothetical protein
MRTDNILDSMTQKEGLDLQFLGCILTSRT